MKYLGKSPIYIKAPTPESEATWERVFGNKVVNKADKVDESCEEGLQCTTSS